MTEAYAVPSMPAEEAQSFSWIQAWTTALTRPSVAAYEALLRDPKAGMGRAVAWILVSSLVSYGIIGGIQALLLRTTLAPAYLRGFEQGAGRAVQSLPAFASSLWIAALCFIPIAVAAFLIGQLFYAGILHFTASALGSQGTYGGLTYAIAAYTAPFTLLSSLLGLIPVVNCLTLPMGLYTIGLHLLAVKAATRMSWGRTIASILIVGLLFTLVAVVAALFLIGPVANWLRTLPQAG